MKEWILSICSLGLIITAISMILPSGKLGKFIKSIFSLIMTLAIIKPILTFDYSDINLDFTYEQRAPVIQENFLDYTTERTLQKTKSQCQTILNSYGVSGAAVDFEYSITNNKITYDKVTLNLEHAVIISNKEHINIIEEIKTALSEYLAVNKNVLVVYGK